jgi:L,D-transpeptidase catalytic domain
MHLLFRLHFAVLSLIIPSAISTGAFTGNGNTAHAACAANITTAEKKYPAEISERYAAWQLDKKGISADMFACAMKGFNHLREQNKLSNTSCITVADFSKPSTQKRLFVIDTETGNVIFKTFVAHGRNSGKEYARAFSNAASSYAISPGFYITSETYNGKHGYSLKLKGCERGINDNAFRRAVVLHGADYVSESFIRQNGYLGRSQGCPAVPNELSQKIIDVIKGGSCLFIYFPSKKYLQRSPIING